MAIALSGEDCFFVVAFSLYTIWTILAVYMCPNLVIGHSIVLLFLPFITCTVVIGLLLDISNCGRASDGPC